MFLCRDFSCVVGRGCLLWPVHSLGRTLLDFALLHSVLQGQICLLLQVFLDFLSPIIGKDPDAEKDWGQGEKGMTEDEMVGWHHRLNGHGFGWSLGVGDGQGGLACCGSWGHKESDTTEQLNWTELNCSFPEFAKESLPRVAEACLRRKGFSLNSCHF